jgi:hypothetical protein
MFFCLEIHQIYIIIIKELFLILVRQNDLKTKKIFKTKKIKYLENMVSTMLPNSH